MFCKNCGAKVDGRKKFCDACGSALREIKAEDILKLKSASNVGDERPSPYQPTAPPYPLGVELSGALIFSIIPGGGMFYFGKKKKGYWYIGIGISLLFLVILVSSLSLFMETWFSIVVKIIIGLTVSFCIWNIIETVWLMHKYAKFVRKHFRAPEEDEQW